MSATSAYTALLETLQALVGQREEELWPSLLRSAVEVVPGAEGGAIIVRRNHRYRIIAICDYPPEVLGLEFSEASVIAWHGDEEAWRRGEPRIANGAALEKLMAAALEQPNTRAALAALRHERVRSIRANLCLPLLIGNEVAAFIHLDNRSREEAFTFASLEATRLYALQATALLAAQNQRSALEARLREFEIIEGLTQTLNRATRQEEIVALLVQEISRLMNSPHVHVLLRQPEADWLESVGWLGLFERHAHVRVPRGMGLSWASLEHKQVLRVENAPRDPRNFNPGPPSHPHAQLTAPMFDTHGEPLGVLHSARDLPASYTPFEERLLGLIANVAATALERSRKSAHLERQLRESQGLLHTVTALAVGSGDQAWSELLRCAVEMVPGAEGGSIFVREGEAYKLVAQMGYNDCLLGAKVVMPIHRYWHPQPDAWLTGEPRIAKQDFLRQAVRVQDQFMDVASARLFEQWGRLDEIRCSLCLPVVLAGEVQGFINLDNFSDEQALDERSVRVARNYALQITALLTARREREEREAAYEGALRAIGVALEARDLETAGHTDRVALLAELLGQELGLGPTELRELRWGAYLHDLGKLAVPDSILIKPTELDSEQWQVMQSHTTLGYHFTRNLPFLPEAARLVVLHHHECWDGTGYPSGLMGPDIPLAARIFAVCDVFDALISPRPYKEAWTIEQALSEVRSKAGTQFDPAVIAAFDRVVQRHPDALRLEVPEPGTTRTR